MERTLTAIDPREFPPALQEFLMGAAVYDSSCSLAARVWFIDRENGFFLKKASKGVLETEAKLTDYFYRKGLSAQVLAYEQTDADWLLTRRIPGEDCIHPDHLSDPKKLCDTTAEILRTIHETDFAGCPVPNRTAGYLATVETNFIAGKWDPILFPTGWGSASAEEAWAIVREFSGALKTDTLLHGDYCLPNILLKDWKLSGLIDVGSGGVGDRHIDLFWGCWSLLYNLKTNIYYDRFLDAYGRDQIQPELLRAIAAFEEFG
jgi:kanamycin kinase